MLPRIDGQLFDHNSQQRPAHRRLQSDGEGQHFKRHIALETNVHARTTNETVVCDMNMKMKLKRLWDRFKRWYAPWEPIKLQPTSLSRTVVPPLNVIKAEIDSEGHMRFKRVWHLALMRLLGLGVLVGGGSIISYWVPNGPLNLPILFGLGIPTILFLWLFPRRRFFSSTSIKTSLSQVDWSKYYAIMHLAIFNKTLQIALVGDIALCAGTTAISYILNVYTWNPYYNTYSMPPVMSAIIPKPIYFYFVFAASAYLVVYAILFCAVMWRSDSLHAELDEYDEAMADLTSGASSEAAMITMPTRCYKDDSHNVYVSVWPTVTDPSTYVEAELQAVGMKVIGSLKQRLPLSHSELLFFWNFNFATSGTHLVNVFLRLTNAQGEMKEELLRKTYDVHVIALYRRYGPALITTVVALLTFLLGLLHSLGLWRV
jgi:hypothetical protein